MLDQRQGCNRQWALGLVKGQLRKKGGVQECDWKERERQGLGQPPSFKLCGEGKNPKTFLAGQSATGQEL